MSYSLNPCQDLSAATLDEKKTSRSSLFIILVFRKSSPHSPQHSLHMNWVHTAIPNSTFFRLQLLLRDNIEISSARELIGPDYPHPRHACTASFVQQRSCFYHTISVNVSFVPPTISSLRRDYCSGPHIHTQIITSSLCRWVTLRSITPSPSLLRFSFSYPRTRTTLPRDSLLREAFQFEHPPCTLSFFITVSYRSISCRGCGLPLCLSLLSQGLKNCTWNDAVRDTLSYFKAVPTRSFTYNILSNGNLSKCKAKNRGFALEEALSDEWLI